MSVATPRSSATTTSAVPAQPGRAATVPRRNAVLGVVVALLGAVLVALLVAPPQRADATLSYGPGGVTVSGTGVGRLVVVVERERYGFDVDGSFARLVPAAARDHVRVLLDGETLARRP